MKPGGDMTAGPVEDMLRGHLPEACVGAIPVPPKGDLPWSLHYGSRGSGGGGRLLLLVAMTAVSGIIVLVELRGGADPTLVLGAGFLTLALFGLTVSGLMRRWRGDLRWQRHVVIAGGTVHVTDKSSGGQAVEWHEPLASYLDLHHRIGVAGGAATAQDPTLARLDVIEIRHPNPGRTILLRLSHQTQTGGMDMRGLIRAARHQGKAAVAAALASSQNPEVERQLEQAAETLGLPVTRDATAEETAEG